MAWATALLCAGIAPGLATAASPGRLVLAVVGPDGEPVAGARVVIEPWSTPGAGPPSRTTDAAGRVTAVGLDPGRWSIEVSAPGFLPSDGHFDVDATRPRIELEVELRSLDEGTAGFLEGSRATIERWLERGNALLEQGRPAEAREEFAKALGVLPASERPQILQAIARTHFLEGEVDAAVEALERALAIEPASPELAALYRALLESLGRGEEVDRRLAAIAAAGPPREAPPPASSGPAIVRPPVEPPRPGRAGAYRTRFAERSPLSEIGVYVDRFGVARERIAEVDASLGAYRPHEESYSVVAPETLDDGAYGLLVWVSPTPLGGAGRAETLAALARHRLIWVGADNAGNARRAWYRVALALDAAHNMPSLYRIDPRRVYVAGYSGGGRVASALVLLYPEVFDGGVFNFGCDYFRRIAVPFRPGAFWPPKFPEPPGATLDGVRRESRLVYLTGSLDFNRSQTKATWRQAVADGFAHATYLEIPGADHYTGVGGEWLERAFEALDAPLARAAATPACR